MKKCCTCKQEKDPSAFHKKRTEPDGLHKSCKECRKDESKRYVEKHKEAVLKSQRERYHQNRELYLGMMQNYRENNKEKLSKKAKEYREANREMFLEKGRAYYQKNIDKFKKTREETKERRAALFKNYAKNNGPRLAAIRAKRRAAQLCAAPKWLTDEQLEAIRVEYMLAAWCSKVQGQKYHVDHIVPLQGKNVCGLHVPWNLQVIPATDNIKKGNKFYG